MGCIHGLTDSGAVIHICGFSPCYRLPLLDGRRVYMEWHSYLGPSFFYDRDRNRMIDDWWKDCLICRALEWFQGRGERA